MKKNINWFTLIELLVSMTILTSVMFLAYFPYNHYQNKAKLKLTSREISQSFYDAKNMAVSGLNEDNQNRSIWVYIDTTSWRNNYVTFLSYPYSMSESYIDNEEGWEIKLVSKKEIEQWVWIKYLGWYDNLLFLYDSINWWSKIYTFDWNDKTLVNDDEIEIMFSFKDSTSVALQGEITYFTQTNIVDYK